MTKRASPRADLATAALAAILLATSVMRFAVYPTRPLWLDEVWTGVMVTQPSPADFIHQCSVDVNGPLYSVLAALWAEVSGISDRAMRFLPAVFGLAAPLLALAPGKLMDRASRFVWSALLACWIPGILFSQEARPYTLVFALGVANTIAFAKLISDPGRRAAWLWAIVSALFVLAHYFVGPIVLIQGLTYLAVHRRRALATWPAAAAFAPVAAALALQARGLASFATPGTTWIGLLDWAGAYSDVAFLFGLPALGLTTGLWLAAAMAMRRRVGADPPTPGAGPAPGPWAAAGCAGAAILAAFAIGLARPLLVDRYLTGYAPGFLLGLAMIATRFARGWTLAVPALVAPYAILAGVWAVSPHALENRYSWETAADALIKEKIDRLVFFWDSPMGGEASSEKGLGGFFFARAGHPIPVDPIIPRTGEDANPAIIQQARNKGTGILWIYDRMMKGTAALSHPPRLQQLDPTLRCRDFGDERFGILACRQDGERSAP